MGYTTEFEGEVTITPPPNGAEVGYLQAFKDPTHTLVNLG